MPGQRTFPGGTAHSKPTGVGQDENSSQCVSQSSSGHLSEPRRKVGPRSRSTSASRLPGKPDEMNGTSRYLKPQRTSPSYPSEPRESQIQSRDVQNAPRRVRSPRPAARSYDPETEELPRHPYVFKALEEYIISCFEGCDCLNRSFTTGQHIPRAASESSPSKPKPDPSSALRRFSLRLNPMPKLY